MSKHNLKHLYFSVYSDSSGESLCSGPHHTIFKYLHKDGKELTEEDLKEASTTDDLKIGAVDDLQVVARDMENNLSLDTMSANKWLEWYNHLLVETLSENNFNDGLMIEYPDTGTEIEEL